MTSIAVLVGGLAALVILAEVLFPYAPAPPGSHLPRLERVTKNLVLAALNAALRSVLLLPIAGLAARYALPLRPAWMTGSAGLAADLVALDLWIYAWHRVVHAWPFAWRFHQVHHLDERMDVTTAMRFHAGDFVLSGVSRAVVILVLAVPLEHAFVFEVATAAASIFHHGNIRLPAWLDRALSSIIVTPSFHRIHHHPDRAIHDANYATLLSAWDRLFGTRVANPRVDDVPVGLRGISDEDVIGLLALPFRSGGERQRTGRP